MPTYDYDCPACGATLEIFQAMSEAPKRKCPECGALKLKRRIGAGAGILFRGSGFYETDYRSDSYKQAAEKDKPAASSSPSSSTGGESKGSEGTSKQDSKPAENPKSGPAKSSEKPRKPSS